MNKELYQLHLNLPRHPHITELSTGTDCRMMIRKTKLARRPSFGKGSARRPWRRAPPATPALQLRSAATGATVPASHTAEWGRDAAKAADRQESKRPWLGEALFWGPFGRGLGWTGWSRGSRRREVPRTAVISATVCYKSRGLMSSNKCQGNFALESAHSAKCMTCQKHASRGPVQSTNVQARAYCPSASWHFPL